MWCNSSQLTNYVSASGQLPSSPAIRSSLKLRLKAVVVDIELMCET